MLLHCVSFVALHQSPNVRLGSSLLCAGRKKPFALPSHLILARHCRVLLRRKFVLTLLFSFNNSNNNDNNININSNISSSHSCRLLT